MPIAGPIAIARRFRFQWEEAQHSWVLLYPEGMIKLNDTAAEILKVCDGSRDSAALIAELKSRFPGADLEAHVHEFLEIAHERGWIVGA